MKNILKLGFLLVLGSLLMTSCEEDILGGGGGTPGGGGGLEEGPSLSFGTDTPFLSMDVTVAPGEVFSVQLNATQGSSPLNSLTVNENGIRLEDFANRLTIDGQPAPAAALLLPEELRASFSITLDIKAQEDRSASLYQFAVADEAGNTAAVDIEISTELTGTDANPEITLLGNSNIIADASSLVCLNLQVVAGNADLESVIVVDEAGETLAPERLFFGGSSSANQVIENPFFLSADNVRGFEETLCIRAQDDESEQSYTIAIADTRDSFSILPIIINTFPNGVSGQPVTVLEGALFNRAGPAGTGGLDLDSGAGTGSADIAAELVDNGIDIGQPSGSNWIQRISGANGTELRQLIPNQNGLPETFTFEAIQTDTEISSIWANGLSLQGTNPNGEPWTDVVQVGDTFIALREGQLYLMEVTDVFIDPNSNGDFYQLDIKF